MKKQHVVLHGDKLFKLVLFKSGAQSKMAFKINSINEGECRILVGIAREAAETYLREGIKIAIPVNIPKLLEQRLGVFVSLKKKGENGKQKSISAIGYPLAVKPLVEGVVDSAIAAAIRARANGVERIDEVDVEVSIIEDLESLLSDRRASIPEQIKIGRDGILIERGFHRAIYLPQIAVEHAWDGESFLSECCVKAGLMPDAWLDKDTKVYRFKVKVLR